MATVAQEVTMLDAIWADAGNIRSTARKVAAYVTATAEVRWTAVDFALFPDAGHSRINQWPGASVPLVSDFLDIADE